MARTATHNLSSKTRRLDLDVRKKPYYQQIATGITLGYVRKAKAAGSWVVRTLVRGKYTYETIGAADDITLPNDRTILSHAQAVHRAGSTKATAKGGPLTVKQALDSYLAGLEKDGSAYVQWTRSRIAQMQPLYDIRVNRLTTEDIVNWRAGHVDTSRDRQAVRKSMDTANRLVTVLRAALNKAFEEQANDIPSDTAWRKVKQFRDVAVPRDDHFTAAEVRQLIKEAATFDKNFAALIAAGYLTGARIGELVALQIRDLDARTHTLNIRQGKTGPRVCTLSRETVTFLAKCADKRPKTEPLLPRDDGQRWQRSEQVLPFKRAAALAGLSPTATFYALRHSYISSAIVAGQPLTILAKNVGTSVLMIEKTYAKATAETRRDLIEATAPRLAM